MANHFHLQKLKEGRSEWNEFRAQSPMLIPDFESADISLIIRDLSHYNLRKSNLRDAKLNGVNLRGANLYDANLNKAELVDANVSQADLRGANLSSAIVDGIKYDKKMQCLGTVVDTCTGNTRFKRAVIECDYIESFIFEHPWAAKAWFLTSDYGRSPIRAGSIALLFILIFAGAYYIFPQLVHWPNTNPGDSLQLWFTPIYYSVVTFTTLGFGDAYPSNTVGQIMASCEAIIGYIWLGYFVSILAYRASARP